MASSPCKAHHSDVENGETCRCPGGMRAKAVKPAAAASLGAGWATVATIRVPSLVIHRTGDLCLDVEEGRYVAERIPQARFEVAGEIGVALLQVAGVVRNPPQAKAGDRAPDCQVRLVEQVEPQVLGLIDRGLGFLHEALLAPRVRDAVGRQHLDCDAAPQPEVPRFIYHPHAPAAEGRNDPKPVGENFARREPFRRRRK